MANNPFFADATIGTASGTMSVVTTLLNSGKIKIYTGAQPTDANQAITGTLLATLTFGATAFGTPTASGSAGSRIVTATANSITSGTAGNTGTAGYFVMQKSDGSTVVLMGSVGTSGADLNFNSLTITSGATVSCSGFTITAVE